MLITNWLCVYQFGIVSDITQLDNSVTPVQVQPFSRLRLSYGFQQRHWRNIACRMMEFWAYYVKADNWWRQQPTTWLSLTTTTWSHDNRPGTTDHHGHHHHHHRPAPPHRQQLDNNNNNTHTHTHTHTQGTPLLSESVSQWRDKHWLVRHTPARTPTRTHWHTNTHDTRVHDYRPADRGKIQGDGRKLYILSQWR